MRIPAVPSHTRRIPAALLAAALLGSATGAGALPATRPAGFEPNAGQWPAPVRYVARAPGATLFLTPHEAVWRLAAGERRAVRLRWLGADPQVDVTGAAPRAGRVRYVRAGGAGEALPLQARVAYRQLYPGIEVVFHHDRGALEYDFLVAPGADPTAIRFAVAGADGVRLDGDGRLRLAVAGGELVHAAPIAFQPTATGRRPVAAAFRLTHPAGAPVEVSFALGAHDPALPLVIDPTVAYQTTVDMRTDSVLGVAVDGDGNLWMAGTTTAADFPVTDDAIDASKATLDDGYVVKLDAAGELVYATYFGGSQFNCMGGLDVDDDGNAWIAGVTFSNDLPASAGAPQVTGPDGQSDAFLAKLDPSGQLAFATYFGGAGAELCPGIREYPVARVRAADDGAVYVLIAMTTSQRFPGVDATRNGLDTDAFLARFGPGLAPEWGRFIGGSGADQALQLEVDDAGNAYVYGTTSHIFGAPQDFPTTPGAYQTANDLDTSHFIARLSAAGAYTHATLFGPPSGSDYMRPGDIGVDGAGNTYLALATTSPLMPASAGAHQTMLRGFSDLFVAALDPTLSTLRWATYLGGAQAEIDTGSGGAVAARADGTVYVGGVTASPDYPLVDALPDVATDQVLTTLTDDGTAIGFSTRLPIGVFELALADGAVYVGGQISGRTGIAAMKLDEAPAPCAGDCDGDGAVRVNELVTGVLIALEQSALAACASFDADGDGRVVIGELIAAVGAALRGCG